MRRTLPGELVVPDTLSAPCRTWARGRGSSGAGRVVGVTGSAGKTTTKDAIAHLLATELPVGKTIGNFNNHVGVPLSILRLPDGCRAGGARDGHESRGRNSRLAAIARPEVGVVTNVGYAHVEFFDSIEGVAAAKRELIEGLPPDGVAVLNADDRARRALRRGASRPLRHVRLLRRRRCARRECRVHGATARASAALGVDFESPLAGRHARDESAGGDRGGPGLRDRAGAPARGGAPVSRVGKMRGERIEHNGIVDLERLLQLEPRSGAVDARRAARDAGARGASPCWGKCWNWAMRPKNCTGRWAAMPPRRRAVDLLIGVRGAARAMVEEAAAAGRRTRAMFFEDPAEAGECAREAGAAGRCGPVQRFARRAGGEGAGKVYGVAPMLYFLLYEQLYQHVSPFRVFRYTTFRTAFASLTALFLCIALGPWLIDKLREFQIGQYIREEGPKSHQKKAGTPTMGGVLIIISIVDPHAAVGGPALSLRLDRASLALLGYGWIGFLDDYAKVTKQRNLGLSGKRKLLYQFLVGFVLRRGRCWSCARTAISTPTMNIPFFKQFKPSLLIRVADGESLDLRARAWRRSASSWRWWWSFTSNAVNLTDGLDGLAIGLMVIAAGRADHSDLRRRPRAARRVSATRAQSAHRRADHLLRLDDRREPRLPLVQRASGGDLHGRRRLARAGRRDGGGRGADQAGNAAALHRRHLRCWKPSR